MRSKIAQTTLAVLVAWLLIGFLFAEDAGILMPSQYHGDEVSAESGEQWLAVVARRPGIYELMNSILRIDTVNDPVLDDENMKTGKSVSVEGNHSVLFLLKGVPGLQPGPVITAVESRFLKPNEPLQARMSAELVYTIELQVEKPDSTNGSGLVDCEVSISDGRRKQTIFSAGGGYYNGEFSGVGNDAAIEVIWAGDLNQDGRLDLLIDLTDHYNVRRPTLFLSPGEDSGPLLIQVAQHYSVGC